MRSCHCANHTSFSVRPFLKRLTEDDVHGTGNFETYLIFASAKGDWFPVDYFIVYFP